MLQRVVACCSVIWLSVIRLFMMLRLQCVAVYCSVWQCVAACCSVLQRIVQYVLLGVLQYGAVCC